jgi:hypothetical protein
MLIPIPHNASSTTSLLLCLSSAWPTIRTFILRSSAYLLLLNLFLFFDKMPSSPPPSLVSHATWKVRGSVATCHFHTNMFKCVGATANTFVR